MKPGRFSLMLGVVAIALCSVANAQTQEAPGAATPETGVVLIKLSPPIYPPLARQARITGDVKIQVGVRQDGSLASSEVISGHPMLKQAALDSAQKSTFECRGCSEAVTQYPLIYTFGIRAECRFGPNCEPVEPLAPEVTQSSAHVTLIAEPMCICDPAATMKVKRVRSPRCLYLWKCGFREVAD